MSSNNYASVNGQLQNIQDTVHSRSTHHHSQQSTLQNQERDNTNLGLLNFAKENENVQTINSMVKEKYLKLKQLYDSVAMANNKAIL